MPQHIAASGHRSLGNGDGLWLSTDPAGQGCLTAEGTGKSLRLALENGDSGHWVSFGFLLNKTPLETARRFGLLITISTTGPNLAICTPTLRYRMETGLRDVAAAPLVLTGMDQQPHLIHIPLDQDLVENCKACEFNLFFQADRFQLEIHDLDPVIIR